MREQTATLVDLLGLRATETPNQLAYSFLTEEGGEERITYGQLDRRARALAVRLQTLGGAEERVLLLYQPSIDYIVAFFGCLYAGMLAVPAYPPRANGNLSRLQAVVSDAQATIALSTEAIFAGVERRFADTEGLAHLRWGLTDAWTADAADAWQEPLVTRETLAFLQYTSGSTSAPKGVMLSHGNLLHNLGLIEEAFGVTPTSKGVIWLPPYHDMGLIGGILNPLYTGYPTTLMAPVTFIQRPLRWLQAISDTGATVSGGPNFAYDLCLQKVTPEQRDRLDLSSWCNAFSGAEPVRAETLERFAAYFAPTGFRKEAFYPCYGLAEGTLFVSGGTQGRTPVVRTFQAEALERHQAVEASPIEKQSQTLVSSGQLSVTRQNIVIASPEELTRCGEQEVGEIWVQGDSVAQGYWRREEQTDETFHAYLQDTGAGPFLRTGDLGFIKQGELYVTGRLKDLIIIRGRNFYPQDLEFSVMECHPAVQSSNGAAFSVEVDGEERLVLVHEVERQYRKANLDEVIEAMRQAISVEHQLQVYAIALIRPASIPKTSSGKIQRHACKARFLAEELELIRLEVLDGPSTVVASEGLERATKGVGASESGNLTALSSQEVSGERDELDADKVLALPQGERQAAVERAVAEKAARVMKVAPNSLQTDRSLNALGLDSLMLVELKNELEEQFSVTLPLESFLDGPTLREVAKAIGEGVVREPMTQATGRDESSSSRFPLSHGQKSLYFLQRFSADCAAYNISRAVRVTSPLDVEAMRGSLGLLIERHPMLGARFVEVDGEPMHEPGGVETLDFAVVEAAGWTDEQVQRAVDDEANRPFDLTQDSVMRVRLYRRHEQEHVMVLAIHHIAVDFWSFGVMMQELLTYYPALQRGEEVQVSAERSSFADHVREQQAMLEGANGEKLLSYWREKLQGELPLLSLPTDRPRPPVQTYRGAVDTFELPEAVTQRLKQVAHKHDTTLYTVLLAAYQVLLYRYTGQEDLVVGSPMAGRSSAKAHDVVGYFVSPVALRASLKGEPTFEDFLAQVGRTVREALAHQDYPFGQLVDRLGIKRDPSYPPLFQTMFTLQKSHVLEAAGLTAFALGAEGAPLQADGLQMESQAVARRFSQLDLSLMMGEVDGRLVGVWEFNSELFDAATVARMSGHLANLLQGIVTDETQAVTALPLVGAEEQRRLVRDWNDTKRVYPEGERCLQELFEAQVERTPDAVAVVCEGESLTYAELNRRANRLAHHLRGFCVVPDTRVGISMNRSLEMVVGLYGILKAGGAYVPIDPTYPEDRLAFLMEDSQVSVLLTQQALADALPNSQAQVLCLDAMEDVLAQESADNPTVETAPHHLAYMIYTSGSTGKPKGAMNEHRGIVNRLLWMQEAYELTAEDRILQKTPFSFDVSVWEFFWPLLTGARLVVAKPEGHKDAKYLVDLIREQGITTLHFVPSMLQVFLEQPNVETCTSVRQVMCSGEALPLDLQERFFARLRRPHLHNLYGPTEAAIDVTAWTCERGGGRLSVPIGKPIANTQMYILDERLQPVPTGVAGELHIGGVQLARGYHNRPELTAEKFIAHPFGEEGERLYKTGDLARYLPDGTIEYLGRIDFQVKIRGFRIELGEIEAVIDGHPQVKQTVVTASEERGGHKRLVAYVVPGAGARAGVDASEQVLTADDLRHDLRDLLPEYMVPTLFVMLDELPLSPNGKVDRRQLPAPEEAAVTTEFVAPRTDVERVLADVIADVLHLERVGIDDNYFERGGDSIRSIQVVARAKQQGLSFALEDLFVRQTVRELAEGVTRTEEAEEVLAPFALLAEADRVKLPADVEDAYPLSKLQEGMLFHSQVEPTAGVYHNVISVHLRAPFDEGAMRRTVEAMIARHPVFRTSFDQETYVETLQLVHASVPTPLVVEDLRHLSQAEQERVLADWYERDLLDTFDFAKAPLVRFHVHRRTEESFQFAFTENHVITDGWSIASMFTEFFRTYVSLVKGEEEEWTPPAVQYRDFVALERQALASEETRAYWREKLSGFSFTQMPRRDQPSSEVEASEAGRYRTVDHPVAAEVAAKLEQVARLAQAPLQDVLLAAHLKVIAEVSGQSDVVTGVVANGRKEAQDGERVFGLHLNSLPLRVELNGGTWIELTQAAFEQHREALPHRRYPMAQMQQDLGGQPLFETLFNFINFHVYEAMSDLPEVEVLAHRDHIYTNFPLAVEFSVDTQGGLNLRLQWDSQTFGEEQIAAMSGYYLRALEGMAQEPTGRYDEHSLLATEEREQVVVGWNETERPYRREVTLAQLFEEQVERTPDAVAVVFAGAMLTYRELNERANQLAHHLQRLGVGPDKLVGVAMERSLEMVIALYGILKAGGAYVPIDPTYPQDRLAFMLADSQVEVLLTSVHLLDTLPPHQAQVLCLDRDWAEIGRQPTTNPVGGAGEDNLAYMIYTSGSTGTPKGVLNEHRGIVNRLLWMQEAYRLTAEDRILQKTPFSFDVSVWEFFWPLLNGARLVVAKPDGHRDALYLANLINEQGVTTMHFVPSMLQLFLEEPAVTTCTSLRQVMCSGEALPLEVTEDFFAKLDAELHNLYGPTEAAVDVSYWACERERALPFVPIGRPVANTQLYVLDRNLRPVPVGTPGELHIGGIQVARGYHNRPELTAERFIADPFAAEPGARLYKTGDLACFLADGTLQYLGRLDHQVKIRGFRIELGEIENKLLAHDLVDGAAVLVNKGQDGSLSLIGFYASATAEAVPTVTELKEFLSASLPDYMIPAQWVALAEIPLSPNGKIDRNALARLAAAHKAERTEAYVAPVNEVQAKLVEIWSELLNVERIGIHDNFFDLGGHSILVGKVYNRLKQAFDLSMSMTDLFQYPTISLLAAAIAGGDDGKASVAAKRFQRPVKKERAEERDIAIIGMGLRFPDANTPDEFWGNLRSGRESIARWDEEETEPFLFNLDPANRDKLVRAGALVRDIDLFDREMFGLSEKEARMTDPQQRLFLMCVWEAIEDAGYALSSLNGSVSLYAGAGMNQYLPMHAFGTKMADIYQAMLAAQPQYMATRVSYKLNLNGESMMVNTACSTSLVAVHMACQSLLAGEAEYALAGGAAVSVPQQTGYVHEQNFIMSEDGHCRAFDAEASGTVPGNGVGVVLLKRLADAKRDGDPIYAVIKGCAINNDGNLKIGYTAPSVQGPAAVIAKAQQAAGVAADSITYVEAHGTGTKLGDPIEVGALSNVFGEETTRKQYCALGSVKTNIGHLDAAAGIAGLIKTALALHHRELPPSLHYRNPNPGIDFGNSPFYVNTELTPWAVSDGPRRAGVSSFGIGGTNAHVVLEEAPEETEQDV
ncbi:MAG TPA: amino acid adenylation domain-containing protein [Bacilli bacterium]|nr:amino acid adenylation domain-containing protein [Bacilli bacterium]